MVGRVALEASALVRIDPLVLAKSEPPEQPHLKGPVRPGQ